MKRPSRSDTYSGLVSICQSTDEHGRASSHVYGGEFQSLLEGLDDEGCVEESVHIAEKKRRLSVDQVKALEKNFEIENKLEPERKVKLAQELGLQPRQVAVWFQNRRARYKTKQLEKDYGILKANFDALKLRFEALQHQNDALREEVRELESKVEEDNPAESQIVIKEEEMIVSESENNQAVEETNEEERGSPKFSNAAAADLKDGSSDSDSSVIFNEGHSPVAASLPFQYQHRHQAFAFGGSEQKSAYQAQYAKVEEHNIFGGEEPSYFFPEDQAPTLQWWN